MHVSLARRKRDTIILESLRKTSTPETIESQIVQAKRGRVSLGEVTCQPVDIHLYLSIKRHRNEDPLLGLSGQVGGILVAHFGVYEVLRGPVNSFDLDRRVPEESGAYFHDTRAKARRSFLTIPASVWAAPGNYKPIGDEIYPAYIPVQNDAAWTLFLTDEPGARIPFGCADCIMEADFEQRHFGGNKSRTVIGYR